jgi:UDPglucose--hexose-1-phosphate uridylyltransferase
VSDAAPELRVDPLSGLKVIVAAGRADRAGSFDLRAPAPSPPPDPADDPFLEGNEASTPPELAAFGAADGRRPDTPGWKVRAVPNSYPALTGRDDAPPSPATHPDPELFVTGPALGAHEVIVNAPHGATTLAELEPAQLALALDAWRDRIRVHAEGGARCVHLFVNEGADAGATQAHTHAQLFALDFVPAVVARERERFGAYASRTMGSNLLADVLQEEVRLRERLVAVDDEAVLLAPYASRLPFQLMLVPRRTRARFEAEGATGAALLHDGLNRLARRLGGAPPLNLWVRTAPAGAEHFCWRIDILPRLVAGGGLELGTGVECNELAPETAAAELRDAGSA